MNHNTRIEETIRNIYHTFEHPDDHSLENGMGAIDNWISSLDGIGGSALVSVQAELRNLRGHMERGDSPAMATSLQQLGQQTSLMARDSHGDTGDHLRHLGQALIIASGNLKSS